MAALLSCAALAQNAQNVSGTVRAAGPLTGVAVRAELNGTPLATALIDAAGRFAFQVPAGASELNLRPRTQLQRLILTHVQTLMPELDTRGV